MNVEHFEIALGRRAGAGAHAVRDLRRARPLRYRRRTPLPLATHGTGALTAQ
jgi:hypothetical protein